MNHTDEAVRDAASVLLDGIENDNSGADRWFERLGVMTDPTELVKVVAQGAAERSHGVHPLIADSFEALADYATVQHRATRSCIIAAALFVMAFVALATSAPIGWPAWLIAGLLVIAGLAYLPFDRRVTRWQREQEEKRGREVWELDDEEQR